MSVSRPVAYIVAVQHGAVNTGQCNATPNPRNKRSDSLSPVLLSAKYVAWCVQLAVDGLGDFNENTARVIPVSQPVR
jgi:hypothetical protein